MKRLVLSLLLLCSFAAHAQNTITFTAAVTSGAGVVTPVLSWDTTPLASDCIASGAWSGPKGGMGMETLADITASATYNLDCTWPGDTTATLTWTNPTTYTNGDPYNDPGTLIINYDQSVIQPFLQEIVLANPLVTSRAVTGLTAGEWCFTVRALSLGGASSVPSNVACKTIVTDVTVNESIGIAVNPQPSAITGLGVT